MIFRGFLYYSTTKDHNIKRMLNYPAISPIIVSLGPISIRWYGMMYLLSFVIGYVLVRKRIKEQNLHVDENFISDLALAILIGVVLGGRLGYAIFYNIAHYIRNPLNIIKIWEGGMSFHGGLIGVVIALIIFARIKKISLYRVADIIIPAVPVGIALGRFGNFINAELYGRITASRICMVFPSDLTKACRYPSQLIEMFTEGIFIFIVVWLLRNRIKTPGLLSWLFLMLYAAMRITSELFRAPDPQIGYILGALTMGQILSIIMLIAGAAGFIHTIVRAGRAQ